MKISRVLTLLLTTVLLFQSSVLNARATSDPMEDILGVYEGYYQNYAGQTGVTLTVYETGSGDVEAIFDFYNLPGHTNAKEGSFYMDVSWKNGRYYFDATEWIERPSGWVTVDIDVVLNGNELSGTLADYDTVQDNYYTFYAEKPAVPEHDMSEILGVYEGYYYANQGQTGVTLNVYETGSGDVEALFEFYNLPNRTNAQEGSFYMDVSWNNGRYYFDATEWIEQPDGWVTVDIDVSLDGYVLSGNLKDYGTGREGYTFYAEKPNDDYAQVRDSIYENHRYELLDQGMTWNEAQAYAEARGGYLAVITSAGEQEFLEKLVSKGSKSQYWLGGMRVGNNFTWVTGESFGYTNWDKGTPDNMNGTENYLQILRQANPMKSGSRALTWNDAPDNNTISGSSGFFSLSKVGMVIEYDPVTNAAPQVSQELQEAFQNGLIPDILIGENMSAKITRAEFAAVAVKLYEALTGNRMIIAMDAPFKDIDDTAERLYILKAYNYDIVNGYNADSYSPDGLLNREQMAVMLTRVYKKAQWPDYTIANDANYPLDYSGTRRFADDADISAFAYGSVYFMAKNGIINGVGDGSRFAPKNTTSAQAAANYANATRQQALLISTRTLKQLG